MDSPSSTSNSETDYGVADIIAVKYRRLLQKDPSEAATLLSACIEWGFFYIDFGDSESEDYLQTVDGLFGTAKEYFAKPLEVKLRDTSKDIRVYNICGFKPLGPLGLDAGNMEQKKNGSENLRVPLDIYFNQAKNPDLRFPKAMKQHEHLFEHFMRSSRETAILILENLSDRLGLKGDERFEVHRLDKQ